MHPLLGSLFVASAALTQSPATQPAPTATRLVWGDFDSDGRPDLFIPDAHAAGRLLRNRGDGGFDDVTSAAGLASRSPARVAAWIDVDDDGRLDLLLGGAEGLQLMRGDGASFRDVTTQAGLEGGLGVRSFAWIDFDADGSDDLELACEEGVRLYRGLGQGVFAPVDLGLPPPQARGVVTVGPGEERPPSAEPLKPSAAGRGAAAKATALAGGFTASAGGSAFSPAKAAGICAGSIVDAALGGCIPASAVPALGSLLPLSIDLNVDLAGNVGMGTSSPASKLHVVGDVRADGQLISTAASGAPLLVSSSTRVAGLNADLLDGVDASAFSQLGGSIESAEITNGTITAADLAAGAVGANALATGAVDTTRIADGTILNSDVASAAAIAGTKISPDFGAQTIRTTGQVGIGTSSPERPLHVVSGSAGAVTPQGNSIAVFERSTNGYVSILTPDGSDKGILFGNPTSNVSGGIVYDQASVGAQSMQLRTGGNVTRMTITGAGDVGLGTTAPEGLLHVQDAPAGTMTAYSNSIAVFEGSSKGFVSILGPDGTAKGLFFGRPSDNRSGGLVYDQASVGNESMQFRTGGNATRMTITQAGDVGIGTSAPTGKLHVADAAGGNSSVVLPSSSISDAEILDEPGLASAKSETLTGLTPVAQTLLSRSISVPSSGYVIATATMTVGVGAFGGGNAYYGINTDGNLASGALEYRFFSDAGAVKDAHQVTLQAVFNVNSAGTTTFFLQAQETSGNLEATNRRLILVFIPTAYGTVTLN